MFAFKLKLNGMISTRNGPTKKTKRLQYRFSVLTLQGRRHSQVCLSSHSSRIVDSSNPLHTSLSLTGIIYCSRHGTLHVILFSENFRTSPQYRFRSPGTPYKLDVLSHSCWDRCFLRRGSPMCSAICVFPKPY